MRQSQSHRGVHMRNVFFFFAAFTVVASCTATTPKQAPPEYGHDCVFFRTLYDWQTLDDHNMIIWAPNHRDAYHLYFLTPLVGLNFNLRLGFVDRDRDGLLCGFSRDEVVAPDPAFPQRASITSMKLLDADSMAQLEEKYKVKLNRDYKKQKPKEPDRETAQ